MMMMTKYYFFTSIKCNTFSEPQSRPVLDDDEDDDHNVDDNNDNDDDINEDNKEEEEGQ